MSGVSCWSRGSWLWTQAHARKLLQVFRCQLPTSALCRELSERPMEGTACRLNHFGVIVVADAQNYRNLKTGRPAIDLKRDTNLSILPASAGRLDPRHFDLEFTHRFTRFRATLVLLPETPCFLPPGAARVHICLAQNRTLGMTRQHKFGAGWPRVVQVQLLLGTRRAFRPYRCRNRRASRQTIECG